MDRGVLSPLSPIVHDQLLGLTDIEGEVVVPVSHCQVTDLLPIGCLIVAGDQAYHHRVVSKTEDGVGVMRGHSVMGEQGVQEGTKDTPLWGPRVKGKCGRNDVAYPHHLGLACQEVQDPVAEGGVRSQGPKLGDELGGDNGVER